MSYLLVTVAILLQTLGLFGDEDTHDSPTICVFGQTFFPLVVVLNLEREDELGNKVRLHVAPDFVSARWSLSPKSNELDPSKRLPLEKNLGKPVLFNGNQSATVWVRAKFGGGLENISYGVNGDLILEAGGKMIYRRSIKEILKEEYKGKVIAKATASHIVLSPEQLNGKEGVLLKKGDKPSEVKQP